MKKESRPSANKEYIDGVSNETCEIAYWNANTTSDEHSTFCGRRSLTKSNQAVRNNRNDLEISFEKFQGSVCEYLTRNVVREEVSRKFNLFLRNKDVEGEKLYINRINEMARSGERSLEVDFAHLVAEEPLFATWSTESPKHMLDIFHKCIRAIYAELYPENVRKNMNLDLCVRITNLPVNYSIRNLRNKHLDTLVRVWGVVTRRTAVLPQLLLVAYECEKCGYSMGPIFQDNVESESRFLICANCQSDGPFVLSESKTIYRNYQRLIMQESPGSVVAGRLPRSKAIILIHDLVNRAKPGEEIGVTGIYRNIYDASFSNKHGFPVFNTVIEANHLERPKNEFRIKQITDEDRSRIMELSRQPEVTKQIFRSMAPFIYGNENVKTGLALTLFGGQQKTDGKHRIRGDINALLLGDPGTAKSQFLKYIEKTADRTVYTTGKGASAVGLTASVHIDPISHEWTLEGGALVLADRGICLIDEFDKMKDQDRVSIHEAMEQQSISISKAGIVAQLQARCTVIAAANPIGGSYDPSKSFLENVTLTDPIISRFDIICVIKDEADPIVDERLAAFVLDSHARYAPCSDETLLVNKNNDSIQHTIPQDLLRKYIRYAKEYIKPKLRPFEDEKIAKVYAELRRESTIYSGMPIAVRHLESILRISEAHARMRLREVVSTDDVDLAIQVMVESYLGTQKYGTQKSLRRKFQRHITNKADIVELCIYLLHQLIRNQFNHTMKKKEPQCVNNVHNIEVKVSELNERLSVFGIVDIDPFLDDPRLNLAGYTVTKNRTSILYHRHALSDDIVSI